MQHARHCKTVKYGKCTIYVRLTNHKYEAIKC